MSNNWFSQASTSQPPAGGVSSGSLFASQTGNSGASGVGGGFPSPSSSLLFGAQQVQPSNQGYFPSSGSVGGGSAGSGAGGGLTEAQLASVQPLKQRYLESFNPGSNNSEDGKKMANSPKQSTSRLSGLNDSSPASVGGSGTQGEPIRFGTNSLYGNGGMSPSRMRLGSSNVNSNNNGTPQRQMFGQSSTTSNNPMYSSSPKLNRSRSSFSGVPYGSASPTADGNNSFAMDEDAPPQVTYMDDAMYGGATAAAMSGKQPEQSADGGYGRTDTKDVFAQFPSTRKATQGRLQVFGIPYSQLPHLQAYLSRFGTVTFFELGPPESNYVVIEFAELATAARLLRKSGELSWGRAILGVRPYDEDESVASEGANNGQPFSPQQRAGEIAPSLNTNINKTNQSNVGVSGSQALGRSTGLNGLVQDLRPSTTTSGSVFVNSNKQLKTPQKQLTIAPEYMFGEGQGAGQGVMTPGGSRWYGLPMKISETIFGR